MHGLVFSASGVVFGEGTTSASAPRMSPSFLRYVVFVAFALAACSSYPEPPADEGRPAERDASASVVVPPSESEDDVDVDEEAADAGSDSAPPPCTKSFTKDIVPAIAAAGCASIACHGTRLGKDPRLEPKNPSLTYEALVAYKLGGKPYVLPQSFDPSASAMSCHFHGKCGKKMPPNGEGIPEELAAAVDAWLACGAPKN